MPKGSSRKDLEKDSRVKVVTINRTMNASQIKLAILKEFQWVHSYTLLTLGPDGNTLQPAANQSPNGNEMVDKRGQVYIHEKRSDPFIVRDTFC